jgi:ribosomal-protein-serine acetyltransferase
MAEREILSGLPVDEELTLRVLEPRDAPALFALTDASRASLREWLPWVDATTELADSQQFIEHGLRLFADRIGAHVAIWACGELAGVLGLDPVNWANRSASLGYWLGEPYRGRGIMTRSVSAVLDLAFGRYGLHRVEIRAAPGNVRSRAIPERLGFTEEGLCREVEWLYDHFVDHVVYGMLVREWTREVTS